MHMYIQCFIHLLNCCVESNPNVSRFKFNQVGQRVLFVATSDNPKCLKANLWAVNNDLYFSADLFAGTF